MLRRLGIRGKVLAALSVPVLVILALAGQVSLQAIQEARTARTVTSLLRVVQESRELVDALQTERAASLPYVNPLTPSPDRAAVDTARAATASQVQQLEGAIAEVDFDALDPAVATAVRELRSDVDGLEGVHGRVDASNVPLSSILTNYTRLIEDAVDFSGEVADALGDRRLAAILSAHTDVTSLVEDYREEQAYGAEVLRGQRETNDVLQFATLFPQSKVAHQQTSGTVRSLDLGEGVVVPPLGASFNGFQSYDSYRTLLATGESQNFDFILPEDWKTAADAEIEAFEPLTTELRQAATRRADAVAADAVRTAVLTTAIAVGALVASIVIALSIARQIVVPLRRLTEAAANVRDELPRLVDQVAVPGQGPDLTLTQIPVTSRDEVGQLAAAFNEVNATTIQVAQEQAALRGSIAEMFVNVARRDQVLLNRQLSFIDALERSEEDPKTLADLFRLDHLATRMRRNAESLLVLAGIDTGRRLRDALPLSDVIRTASSEIEHYERVQLDLPVDPMMLGHTALPAAHLMAELLENATVFSEPGTPVQVSTGLDEHGVLITVLDQGLGMTPEELADANEKIRTTSAGDVLGSQRLGMFVVGRIASRLGATAELSLGPDGKGTLATIRLPHVLFTDSSSLPHTAPTRAGVAQPQAFVLPEQAAEVVHDAAYAPAPAHVQDVAPGAYGSAENPAEEVDLSALTDGQTGLGLPRRRARGADEAAPAPSVSHREADDAAAAPSIPLAPQADALAGAAAAGEEAWAPPVVLPAGPLSVRRGSDDAGLPTRRPAADGPALPTRQPAAPAEGVAPVAPAAGGASGLPTRTPSASALPTRQPAAPAGEPRATTGPQAPVAPEGRAAMFSGFRSRRAELAAAAIHIDSGDAPAETPAEAAGVDGAERLAAAAAGAAAFFGRGETPAEDKPMVIPALVEDDEDEYLEPEPAFEPAPEQVAQPEAEQPQPWAPEQPAPEPQGQPWAPAPAAEAQPWAPVPAAEAQPWAPQPEAQPAAQAQPWAPQQPEAQPWAPAPAAEAQPVAQAQPWAPQQPEAQPAVQAQPWAPQPEAQPAAQAQPWAAQQPEPQQPWAPQPAAAPQPWAAQAPAAPAPQPQAQPWAAQQAPVAPAPAAPVPAPLAPVAHEEAPAFSELVQGGPSRRDIRGKKPRRRLFGRKQDDVAEVEAPAAPVPAAPVQPAPVAAAPAVTAPPAAPVEPTVPPVRQSAWGSADAGVHAMPEPVAPAAEVPAAPVAGAPAAAQAQVPGAPRSLSAAFQPRRPAEPQPAPVAEPAAPAAPAAQAHPWNQPPADTAQGWQGAAAAAVAESSAGWAPTPAWQPGTPQAAAPQAAPLAPAPTPAPAEPSWAPAQGWSPSTPADVPARPTASIPTPHQPPQTAPAAPAAPAPQAPGPQTFTPQTFTPQTFTPQAGAGAFDDEVTNMLAQRADIAQQALAELSQLSSYRPAASSGGSTLARRTPGTVPAAPEIKIAPSGQRVERDANQVRSLLSSFQSGTSRGRQAAPATAADQTPGGATPAGKGGPDETHGIPVTTPDTDLTERTTSW